MRYTLPTLLIIVSLCGVFFAVAALAGRLVRPTYVFGIRAQFAAYPADDEGLKNWLEDQPGCFRVDVHRDRNGVRVYWLMSRNYYGDPPEPQLEEHFHELGYGSLLFYDPDWRD